MVVFSLPPSAEITAAQRRGMEATRFVKEEA